MKTATKTTAVDGTEMYYVRRVEHYGGVYNFAYVLITQYNNTTTMYAMSKRGHIRGQILHKEENLTDKQILFEAFGIDVILDASPLKFVRHTKQAYLVRKLPDIENQREHTWLVYLSDPIILSIAGVAETTNYIVICKPDSSTAMAFFAWPTGTSVSENFKDVDCDNVFEILLHLGYEFVGPPSLSQKIEPEIQPEILTPIISKESDWLDEFQELTNRTFSFTLEYFMPNIEQTVFYNPFGHNWYLHCVAFDVTIDWWVAKFIVHFYLENREFRFRIQSFQGSNAQNAVRAIAVMFDITFNQLLHLYIETFYSEYPTNIATLFVALDFSEMSAAELENHLLDWLGELCS